MDRRVLPIVCVLSLTLAHSVALAQGAASSAGTVNSVKAADSLTANGGVAAGDSASDKPAVAKNVLDLDKLLVADEEGDLLNEDKPVVTKTISDSANVGQASSKADGQLADESESVKADADSAGRASAPQSPGRRGPPSKTAIFDTEETGPSVVEEGRTINFAQNLKEYRSPRLAMLLSLLVPGLGQAYSRSYIKASAFGAAEIAAIGVAVYLNSVSQSKKREAYNHADKYFDSLSVRIRNYDNALRDAFVVRDDNASTTRDSIQLPYDQYFYNAAKNKDTYYYESIRGKEFTPGWEDYNLSLADVLGAGEIMKGNQDTIPRIIGTDGSQYELYDYLSFDKFYYVKRVLDRAGNQVSDGDWVLGHSDYQAQYNAMMDNSNSYRDAVNYMFYVILLNHIASSIDAGFTARAYNARLLGEDNSAWNRLSVEQLFVFTGTELSPGVALRVRF